MFKVGITACDIRSRNSIIIVCCLLLILLAACSIDNNLNVNPDIDDGFFSGNPCGPPCLLGITPGVTKEAEAIKILKNKGIFQNCKVYNNENQGGIRGISCRSIGVSFQQGIDTVNGIGFSPFHRITMENVISKYGKPDTVLVTEVGTPEFPRIVMLLYYDDIQTRLNLFEQEGIIFRVEASTTIESISYSASYNRSKNEIMDFLQEWKGYGEYRQIKHFD